MVMPAVCLRCRDGGGTRYVKVRTVGKGAFGTAVLYRKEPEGALVVIKQV